MTLTLGSLFSGVGGIDLAFEHAGWECRWQVENDPACNRVLEHHWPSVARYADVREVNPANLEPVDLIAFGSPCQDLSVAGKRGGLAGERSGLFYEAIRIIRGLHPALALWENVPGALSSHGGRDFGAAIDALANAGAVDICWAILDAQWYGVAQRRRRVFLVADFAGERADAVLPESESGGWHPPPSREAGQRPAFTLAVGSHGSGGFGRQPWNSNYVAATLSGGSHGAGVSEPGRRREDDVNLIPLMAAGCVGSNGAGIGQAGDPAMALDTTGAQAIAYSTPWDIHFRRIQDVNGIAPTLIAPVGRGQGAPTIAHTLRAEGADASEDGTGRGVPIVPIGFNWQSGGDNRIHPTDESVDALQTSQVPAVGQGMAVRRLMPVECLRLQGLPDEWLDVDPPLSDSVKYRLVGNSVACPVVNWIAKRLMLLAEESSHVGS